MKKSLLFLLAFLASVALFQSCKKDNSDNDPDLVTSQDLAESEDYDEQIDMDADAAIEERGGPNACPVVTMDQPYGTWPNTITIDFGTGCSFPKDDRVFKGKIIISQTDDVYVAGAVRTRTFDGFYIDDVHIEGTKTWTNNGKDAAGNWSYTKTATDMKHSFADGTFRSWNATHTSTLIEGGDTPLFLLDNAWSTTGTASGVNRNGVAFSATISDPLIKKASCRWISQGTVSFVRGTKTSSLDFGDGDCDRFGTLTNADGETFTIKLRR